MEFSGEINPAENGSWIFFKNENVSEVLAGKTDIEIEAKGDGKTYWVHSKTEGDSAWEAQTCPSFLKTKKGEWQKYLVLFDQFVLTRWIDELEGKALNLSKITSLGLGISNLANDNGPFMLEKTINAVIGDKELLEAERNNNLPIG